jgi:hypothetical protein
VDTLPQIGLGTAVLLVFATIVALVVLRGVVRMMWGLAQLVLAGAAALWVWHHGPPAAVADLTASLPLGAVSAAAAGLTLLLGQGFTRLLRALLRDPLEDAGSRRSPTRWAVSLLLSLVATLIVCLGTAIGLHHFGIGAEIEAYLESRESNPASPADPGLLARWRQQVESVVPARWLSPTDPATEEARLRLIKQMAAAERSTTLDDLPGGPWLRDWLRAHPELRDQLQRGRYAEAMRDPAIDALLADPALREILAKPGH